MGICHIFLALIVLGVSSNLVTLGGDVRTFEEALQKVEAGGKIEIDGNAFPDGVVMISKPLTCHKPGITVRRKGDEGYPTIVIGHRSWVRFGERWTWENLHFQNYVTGKAPIYGTPMMLASYSAKGHLFKNIWFNIHQSSQGQTVETIVVLEGIGRSPERATTFEYCWFECAEKNGGCRNTKSVLSLKGTQGELSVYPESNVDNIKISFLDGILIERGSFHSWFRRHFIFRGVRNVVIQNNILSVGNQVLMTFESIEGDPKYCNIIIQHNSITVNGISRPLLVALHWDKGNVKLFHSGFMFVNNILRGPQCLSYTNGYAILGAGQSRNEYLGTGGYVYFCSEKDSCLFEHNVFTCSQTWKEFPPKFEFLRYTGKSSLPGFERNAFPNIRTENYIEPIEDQPSSLVILSPNSGHGKYYDGVSPVNDKQGRTRTSVPPQVGALENIHAPEPVPEPDCCAVVRNVLSVFQGNGIPLRE